MTTVPCFHCGARFSLDFEPDPSARYVCDPCADSYQEHLKESLATMFGDAAFRCEKCGTPVVGDPLGAQLCDPCEDELHAEALAESPR